jgi:hypothetical protein
MMPGRQRQTRSECGSPHRESQFQSRRSSSSEFVCMKLYNRLLQCSELKTNSGRGSTDLSSAKYSGFCQAQMWVPCWCKGMSTSAMVGIRRSEGVGRTEGFRSPPRVWISGRNASCSGREPFGVQCFYGDPGVMEKWRVSQTHHLEGVAPTRHAGPVRLRRTERRSSSLQRSCLRFRLANSGRDGIQAPPSARHASPFRRDRCPDAVCRG